MKRYRILLPLLAALALVPASCVHEFPDAPATRPVELTISHDQSWVYQEIEHSRGTTAAESKARYHFMVTPIENNKIVVLEEEQLFDDLSRQDFATSLQLPAGVYNIWVWSDHAHHQTGISHHYDSSDFFNITYSQPYHGNDESRDSFRGMTTVEVENTIADEATAHAHIDMERPLARYYFYATDLEEFVERELEARGESRGPLTPEDYETLGLDAPMLKPFLASYRVEMVYTGYMPSKFNNFINRPVDSATGVSYDSNITLTDDNQALLGFDYVMVNGHASAIPVAMNIYDSTGKLVGSTSSISVPIVRGQTTIVRGKFLTSRASAGVVLDPSFNGDFNIEIK